MAITVLGICCGLLAYVYVLYPLLVQILAARFGKEVARGRVLRRVTIIVTAYNEEQCIQAKLDNLAELKYPSELVEILVVSDGSSDRTEQIAAGYKTRPVRVLRVEGRRGKTACQNAAAAAATGEILVFTDATTRVQVDALMALVENFADPDVGCVGGRLEYVTDVANTTGCGGEAYWSYEMRLRAGESSLGSLIGVSGCLYAVRKIVYQPIDPELISDFVIAMKMREQCLRTALEPRAVCFEATLETGRRELAMRVRVAVRSLNALVRGRRFLNPLRYGWFAWQLWSHKVLRYASPVLWLGALAANVVLVYERPFRMLELYERPSSIFEQPFFILLLGQCVIIGAGLAGFMLQNRGRGLGLLSRPYYFLLTNAAALIAMLRYLRGERMVVWTPMRLDTANRAGSAR
jgi:cellulose synthase/poly-beta-1,6-N-acetylglucosamine synthase-like glycosyltransferase